MCQYNIPTLLQIIACQLLGAKPLSEIILPYYQLDHKEHISVKFYLNFKSFHSRKCTWKCCLWNGGHFVLQSSLQIHSHVRCVSVFSPYISWGSPLVSCLVQVHLVPDLSLMAQEKCFYLLANTVWCRYSTINFLWKNYHYRHPIARPSGWGMVCLFLVWSLVYVLLLSSQHRMYCRDKFDVIITLDCRSF